MFKISNIPFFYHQNHHVSSIIWQKFTKIVLVCTRDPSATDTPPINPTRPCVALLHEQPIIDQTINYILKSHSFRTTNVIKICMVSWRINPVFQSCIHEIVLPFQVSLQRVRLSEVSWYWQGPNISREQFSIWVWVVREIHERQRYSDFTSICLCARSCIPCRTLIKYAVIMFTLVKQCSN